jgi:phosphoribosylaminoimidazolecarboxamide formyltransferase/IMP cyclohydrolase
MENLTLNFINPVPLRYGENSHQNAVFYKDPNCTEASLATAEQLHGKELSYNNIVDADAALEMIREFSDSNTVAIIKHLNPCGLATGHSLAEAFNAAWEGDPVSAFGSVIAASRKIDLATAELLKGRFVEILLAPDFEADALEFLRNKSKDIRLLKVGKIEPAKQCKVYKHVIGGMLVQDRDIEVWEKFECVTKTPFPKEKEALAKFSWLVCKHTKSNAIVMCHEYKPGYFMVLGLGPGQPNRIDSNLRLCQPRAADNIKRMGLSEDAWGSLVLASDAFFPFADNVDASNSAGIKYIVQPGGSKRDGEVIEACDRFGIAMAFTGTRHFRH